jgi:diguanylate cyclase (GGDEF)-like protein/PAS domain S-box-containing protein
VQPKDVVPIEAPDPNLLGLLVETVEDYAILVLDLEGRIASWNVGARRLKGYRPEQIVGRHFSVLYPPEDVAARKPQRELEIAAADGRLEDEGWRVRADGTRFWADVVITALRDADGVLCGYGKITRDLTERRAREQALGAREELATGVLAAATAYSIIGTDASGTINLFSAGAEQMLGRRAADVIGRQTPAVFHDAGELASRAAELGVVAGVEVLLAAARRGEAETREWTFVRADGSRLPVALTVNPTLDDAGRPRGFIVIAADVSDQRAADAALRVGEERFRRAFHAAPVGLAVTAASRDGRGRYVDVNRAMCDLTGYDRERLLHMTPQALTHPADVGRDDAAIRDLFTGVVSRYHGELRYVCAHGEVIEVSVGVSLIRDVDGRPSNFIAQVEDVSARKRSERELLHLASHDALTGLATRARLHAAIDGHAARVRRYGPAGALLMIDLDHFKAVNDRLGHNVGDRVLIDVAHILQGRVREADVLGRLGGDEFGVLMTAGGGTEAQTLADDLAELVRRGGIVGGVTASIGITVFDAAETRTTEEILGDADSAMYAVKQAGRSADPGPDDG